MTCKRLLSVFALAFLTATAFAQTPEPSLGDVARQQRTAKKPAKRVITNDDIAPAAAATSGKQESTPQSPNVAKTDGDSGDGAKTFSKKQQEFRGRYVAQKKELEKLQAEVATLERERQQRVAGYYADAGNRLRDDKNWADKQRKLESDIAEKQKQIDKARQSLEEIKEQARRAGVPERVLED